MLGVLSWLPSLLFFEGVTAVVPPLPPFWLFEPTLLTAYATPPAIAMTASTANSHIFQRPLPRRSS